MGTGGMVIKKMFTMKLGALLLFILFALSCSTAKEMQQVKFRYSVHGRQHVVSLAIPKSAKLIKVVAGGEGEEHRYFYSDSSVIYITSLSGAGTLNESLINRSADDYNKRFSADTASFTGIDKNGLYWKEIKHYGLFYGYAKVLPAKKLFFDKALTSARHK